MPGMKRKAYQIVPPEHIKIALAALRDAGFSAVIVGGCVRDAILGVLPSDWDIATSAHPMQIKHVFKDFQTQDDGIKHGTVRVVSECGPIEITTYRRDGRYLDNRRPDRVFFTRSLRIDLSRRDFTVNAMAYITKNSGLFRHSERVYDPFGGMKDLEKRTIRCVGNPHRRFSEDALRIWRALRFASVLDFAIDPHTAKAAQELKDSVNHVSKERITAELIKFITGPGVSRVYKQFFDIARAALPALPDPAQVCADLERAKPDKVLRLAALFGDKIAASDCIARLALSNELTRNILLLLSHKHTCIPQDAISARVLMSTLCRPHDIYMLLDYWAVIGRDEKELSDALTICAKVIKDGDCLSIAQLAINGTDLAKLGIPQGREVGTLLKLALDAVIKGMIENNAKALLDFIKQRALIKP